MPRKARCLVDGGYYHVVTRGIDKRRLFRCKDDYGIFYGIIRKYLKSYQIHIMHYCFMVNHIHLLIKAEKGSELPKFMQAILQTYASIYRTRYKSAGFVFQNRYKSKCITHEAYLLECARYIERNPVRAGIASDLLAYRWSSYAYYANGKADGIITEENPLYSASAQTAEDRRSAFIKFVSEERLYDHIVDKEFRIR